MPLPSPAPAPFFADPGDPRLTPLARALLESAQAGAVILQGDPQAVAVSVLIQAFGLALLRLMGPDATEFQRRKICEISSLMIEREYDALVARGER